MFGGAVLSKVRQEMRAELLERVEQEARAELFRDGRWVLDYRRLRVVAVKT
jgi:hypothetical protein